MKIKEFVLVIEDIFMLKNIIAFMKAMEDKLKIVR